MKQKLLKTLVAMSMTGYLLGGSCVSAEEEIDISEHVELTMYLVGSEGTNHQAVMDALNKKLEEDLNCTLTVKYIGFGEYDTKYPLVLSSGEEVDLIYTSSWLNYSQLADKGAFMAIEDLLPVYAPLSTGETDIEALENMDEDGHIYFLPSNHPCYYSYGISVRSDVLEEYGISELTSIDEYLDFTAQASNDGWKDSLSQSMHNYDEMYLISQGYYPLSGGTQSAYWLKPDGSDNYTVYIKSEVPELQDYLEQAQERCNAGSWSQSALSNTDAYLVREGLSAGCITNVETWIQNAVVLPDAGLNYVNISEPIYEASILQDAMAIPSTSKHPERALMVLEKLRQDESYYNLLTYGIEGENYELLDDGTIQLLDQDGYSYENGTWGFRDDKFYCLQAGAPENANEIINEIADNVQENIFKSFLLSTESIKNEYAAVQNAVTQYYDPLALGYVDYESGMESLNAALGPAGNDTCLEELQRQVDEFVARIQ